MLRPFDGKPFTRKPIAERGKGKAAQDTVGEEERRLERLEQAGVELVFLFQDAAKDIEAASRNSPRKTSDEAD